MLIICKIITLNQSKIAFRCLLNLFFHLQVAITAARVQAETLAHLLIYLKEWWTAVRWLPWLPQEKV